MEFECDEHVPPWNEGLIWAPRHFKEELRSIDPHLRVRFRDFGNRWVIYRIDPETHEWVLLRVIATEDNDFHALTTKVLHDLRWGDTWKRPRGVEDILDHMQARNQKIRDDSDARIHDAAMAAGEDVARAIAGKRYSIAGVSP